MKPELTTKMHLKIRKINPYHSLSRILFHFIFLLKSLLNFFIESFLFLLGVASQNFLFFQGFVCKFYIFFVVRTKFISNLIIISKIFFVSWIYLDRFHHNYWSFKLLISIYGDCNMHRKELQFILLEDNFKISYIFQLFIIFQIYYIY